MLPAELFLVELLFCPSRPYPVRSRLQHGAETSRPHRQSRRRARALHGASETQVRQLLDRRSDCISPWRSTEVMSGFHSAVAARSRGELAAARLVRSMLASTGSSRLPLAAPAPARSAVFARRNRIDAVGCRSIVRLILRHHGRRGSGSAMSLRPRGVTGSTVFIRWAAALPRVPTQRSAGHSRSPAHGYGSGASFVPATRPLVAETGAVIAVRAAHPAWSRGHGRACVPRRVRTRFTGPAPRERLARQHRAAVPAFRDCVEVRGGRAESTELRRSQASGWLPQLPRPCGTWRATRPAKRLALHRPQRLRLGRHWRSVLCRSRRRCRRHTDRAMAQNPGERAAPARDAAHPPAARRAAVRPVRLCGRGHAVHGRCRNAPRVHS